MTFNILGREIMIKRDAVIAGIVFLAVLMGTVGYIIARKAGDVIIYSGSEADNLPKDIDKGSPPGEGTGVNDDPQMGDAIGDSDKNVSEEIKVYVIGCVRKPGIVTLKKGQLIDDAVKAAGGLSDDADIYNINLVYSLNENMMLRIKSKNEISEEDKGGKEGSADGGGGKGIDIIRDGGSVAVTGGRDGKGGKEAGGKVNINTASASELDVLPGIGAATANDIIAYRESNGKFKKIEDIMNVPRIKEGRFNSIKDFITVD